MFSELHVFLIVNIVYWLKAQALDPDSLGLTPGCAIYYFCVLGQVTEDLCIYFLVCKVQIIIALTAGVAVKIK